MTEYLSGRDIILVPLALALIYFVSGRIERKNIRLDPIYRYYRAGLFAKVFAGIAVCLVYVYYYGGGDSTTYYYSGIAVLNLLFKDAPRFFSVLSGNLSIENWSFFDYSTTWPAWYMWIDPETFIVARIASLFLLVSFKSYLTATILMAWASYTGVWRLYVLFCEQYPQMSRHFALAVLFMPSVVFWGSGMLKDTITFTAACWFTYGVYRVIISRKDLLRQVLAILVSSYLLIAIKPYIFIALMPGAIIWVSFERIRRVRNVFLRMVVLPVILLVSGFLIVFVFNRLSGALGEYSDVDAMLEKAVVTQQDLRQEYYGGHRFDIGAFDASAGAILSKAPVAVMAALYRPFLWEAGNAMMLLSAVENAFMLALTLYLLLKIGPFRILRLISAKPILIFSVLFSLLFLFAVGLTTANFGAMVRYKIPAIPFFVSALFILYYFRKMRPVKSGVKRG